MNPLAVVILCLLTALSMWGCAPGSVTTVEKASVSTAEAVSPPANVPEPFQRGEKLFRKHGCRGCHGFGEFFGKCPDLAGVTKRDSPKWLRDWLSDPEKMRETDNYARDLSARYEAVMPNLGLKDSEIDDLLFYLNAEGSAMRAAQP